MLPVTCGCLVKEFPGLTSVKKEVEVSSEVLDKLGLYRISKSYLVSMKA